MASFTRAKRSGSRNGRDRGVRGGSGGSVQSRGNRGGRVGRGRGSGVRAKNTFYPTRVEEQVERDEKGAEEEMIDNSNGSMDLLEISSDSGDDALPTTGVKHYSSLLQSLSANVQSGEPQRKKRKVDHIEPAKALTVAEEDIDEAQEPEEAEDLSSNDEEKVDDADDSRDPFVKHLSEREEGSIAHSVKKGDNWGISSEESSKQRGWVRTYHGDMRHKSVHGVDSTPTDIESLHIKERLKAPGGKVLQQLDNVEASLANAMFNYKDIFFPHRTLENADSLREIACLHCLNHLFKTRDRIIKNNARLAREDAGEELELRDQGFTRPKVLIILPTRQSCVRYVDVIVSTCKPEQQENKKRFQDSYANGEDNFSDDKPADFRELFAGNDDDMFRLGMKVTRKTIKYFSQFYNSDIIFASPLGLRMALGADDPRKHDHDFLSSIEIVILDQADAIMMQNWEHIEYIFEHLNLQPRETHGCDFSRVRSWYLDGQAKYLRQTAVFSAFNFPALKKILRKSMMNIEGTMEYQKQFEGAIIKTGTSARQTFSRFDHTSPATEPHDRFQYFSTAIVPSLIKHSISRARSGQGTLIYIPSYADFVRIRNYLANSSETQDVSFGSISEYTSVQEVTRARSHFVSGRHSVLLYTERAHHFRRYHLKGVKQIIMYALPENPNFYSEVAGGFLQSSIASAKIKVREAGVRALFSRLEAMKLERIVGSSRYLPMLADKGGDTFDFE